MQSNNPSSMSAAAAAEMQEVPNVIGNLFSQENTGAAAGGNEVIVQDD